MLTAEQDKWLAHLSDTATISIVPFDPTAEEKFQKVRALIQEALGDDIVVEHHGATSLGISGQDEIDIYLPTAEKQFDTLVEALKPLFHEPKSLYPLKRARFAATVDGKHIDIFPINEESDDWKNLVQFEARLRAQPEKLEAYRKLKESGQGLSVREYYRRKILFIIDVVYDRATAIHRPDSGRTCGPDTDQSE